MKNASLLLIIAVILTASCGKSIQKVKIVLPDDKTVINIDTFQFKGYRAWDINMVEDGFVRQIIATKPNCKDSYSILCQDANLGNKFPEIFEVRPPTPFPLRNENMKYLNVENCSFMVDSKSITFNQYYHSDLVSGNKPYNTSSGTDSMTINENSFLEEKFNKILFKTGFIDTSVKIIRDFENNLKVIAEVKTLERNDVKLSKADYFPSYYVVRLGIKWIITNCFGDTLIIEKTNSASGEHANKISLNVEENGRHLRFWFSGNSGVKAINDAFEASFLDLFSKPMVQKILRSDFSKVENTDTLTLAKPLNKATGTDEALKACVTITNDHKSKTSGFFVNNEGYILTNYMFVADEDKEYNVELSDGQKYPATIVRTSKKHNLAVLKINYKPEFSFELPTARNYKTTDEVYLIGTPSEGEAGQTIIRGIISANKISKDIPYFISNIAINKGYIGAPMFFKSGVLTGIATDKVKQGADNLCIAIPAYYAVSELLVAYK